MIDPALEHYFVSIAHGGEAENLVAQSTSLAKIGNIYKDMYEQESLDYYSLADGLASQTDNSRVKGYVSSGLGAAYEKFGEPQEALRAFKNAVQYYNEAKSPQKAAQNYVNAAEIMLDYNSSNKAKGLLKKAQFYAGQADDIELMSKISEKINKLG
jgi:tetratricopeptide (TPR) repeat protein